jgi:hypothetical protein
MGRFPRAKGGEKRGEEGRGEMQRWRDNEIMKLNRIFSSFP